MQLRWWRMAYWHAACSGVGRAERTMKVALVTRGITFAFTVAKQSKVNAVHLRISPISHIFYFN
jgi:hypothetical protein